ncbi:DUF465 domain-containing protein [Novosphingobium lubricantis]|jgi:hypothetical protein
MATIALDSALDRLEQALARVEHAVSKKAEQPAVTDVPTDRDADDELAILKVRHRKLKNTVAQEIRQLDLLLSGLPQNPVSQ